MYDLHTELFLHIPYHSIINTPIEMFCIHYFFQSSPSGVTYHLEVELAETHCKKYLFVADPERCPIDHSEEREVCQAEVLISQASATGMQLIKLFCDEMNDYYTRRLRGKCKIWNLFYSNRIQ